MAYIYADLLSQCSLYTISYAFAKILIFN